MLRWDGLLCLEVRPLSPAEAQMALGALNAIGGSAPAAVATTLQDCCAHGQRDAAGALERWLDGA
jgi:hypothetical protein